VVSSVSQGLPSRSFSLVLSLSLDWKSPGGQRKGKLLEEVGSLGNPAERTERAREEKNRERGEKERERITRENKQRANSKGGGGVGGVVFFFFPFFFFFLV
jgi:hypothetical protein